MNKRPVSYLQTDPRWKNKPYRVPGENATIGGSGCGPTAAAMLIETITGKTYTPEDACAWSIAHGVVCSFYLNLCKSDHRQGGITYEAAKAANFNVPQEPEGSVDSPAI